MFKFTTKGYLNTPSMDAIFFIHSIKYGNCLFFPVLLHIVFIKMEAFFNYLRKVILLWRLVCKSFEEWLKFENMEK